MKRFLQRTRIVPSIVLAVVLSLSLGMGLRESAHARGGQQWFTAWGTSAHSLDPATTTVSDATVRMIIRPGVTGNALQVKIENTLGIAPLQVGAATIALRETGASLVPESVRSLSFGGHPSIVIPVGEGAWSDEVRMRVVAGDDLAVSLYLPTLDTRPSRHNLAFTTNHLTDPMAGDHTGDQDGTAFTQTTTSWFWVATLDLQAPRSPGRSCASGTPSRTATGRPSTVTTDGRTCCGLLAMGRSVDLSIFGDRGRNDDDDD